MGLKKRLTGIALSAAMVLTTVAVPVTASAADTIWAAPTQPLAVEDNIVKIAAHSSASTLAPFLGANLVTERATDYNSITSKNGAEEQFKAAQQFVKLGVYGSNINESPDPYLWNYFYNKKVAADNSGEPSEDAVFMIGGTGNIAPNAADTTVPDGYDVPYPLVRQPEIILDKADSYTDFINQMNEGKSKDDSDYYDPINLSYQMGDLSANITNLYTVAKAMNSTGKTGRYGDPEEIAKKYETFLKGVQLYILSEIEKGNVEKKTVAIIDPTGIDTDSDGNVDKFQLYDSNMADATVSSCRGAEYCENYTNNLIQAEGIEQTDGKYLATAEQVCKADAIMAGGLQKVSKTDEQVINSLINADENDSIKTTADVPDVHAVDPAGPFIIRANSVENVRGIPLYAGFIYPEVFNPIYGTMYTYKNFWHVKDVYLKDLVEANFKDASLPEGIERSGAGYSEAAVQSMVDQGLSYYNSHKSELEETKLKISNNIDLSGYTEPEPPAVEKISISKAKISTISNRAYTGKAIKPALTVKYNGKTLKKGTDYTVTYKNNIKTGKATATVKGTGKYTGTKSATFKIVPKKATLSKATNVKTRSIKATWKKDAQASGYKVAIATNSSMTKNVKTKYFKSYKTTSTKFTKLKKGKTYYVRVTAYKTIDGKKYYGTKSSYKKVKIKK